MRYAIISLALIFTSFMASAGNVVIRSYALQTHGTFELKVPESWKDSVSQPSSELPPTIRLSPKIGAHFQVLVTPIWRAGADIKPATLDELRATVRQAADIAVLQSVEELIEVKEIKGPSNTGYYFSATDKAPNPGEFKYLNQGVIAVNDLLVSFTILTNDRQDSIVQEALSMLLSAGGSSNSAFCWTHLIPTYNNVISLCTTGTIATMSIYYPNSGDSPTTCTQTGTVNHRHSGQMALILERGKCENGRSIKSQEIACTPDEGNSLSCTTNESPSPMKFLPKSLAVHR